MTMPLFVRVGCSNVCHLWRMVKYLVKYIWAIFGSISAPESPLLALKTAATILLVIFKVNGFNSDIQPSQLDQFTSCFLVPILCERSTATHCSATRSTWVLPLERREGWKAGRGGREWAPRGAPKRTRQDENQRPLSSPYFFLRLITNHFTLAESG